jgi:hypothetical protein
MNVLRVCPFSRLLLAKSVSKGIKCCIYHQRFVRPSVVHLRRSCSHLALLPSLPLARLYSQKNHHFQVNLENNVSAPLCSCSGTPNSLDLRNSSPPIAWTIKNPRAFAAVSGSLHKLAPYLAWVCCPLIGFSPYSTCEVVSLCALRNISASACAGRSERHRALYTGAWHACQPARNRNGQQVVLAVFVFA